MKKVYVGIFMLILMKNYFLVLLYIFIHYNIYSNCRIKEKKINDMDILEKMRFCNK